MGRYLEKDIEINANHCCLNITSHVNINIKEETSEKALSLDIIDILLNISTKKKKKSSIFSKLKKPRNLSGSFVTLS